jgi:protein O-GlcNAc transferase
LDARVDSADEQIRAARGAFARGDIAAAVEGFLGLAAAFPYDKTIAYQAAAGLRACGDARAAAAVLETALLKWPVSVGLLEAAAEAYSAVGLADEATSRLTRAADIYENEVALRPDSAAGWINLAQTRTKLGQQAQADAAHERAQALLRARQNASTGVGVIALLQRAWAADQVHAYDEARANYKTVLEQSPGHIFALTRLLTIDGIEGRLDDAEAHHHALVESLGESDLAGVNWLHLAVIAYQAILRTLPQAAYKSLTREIDRQLLAEAKPALGERQPRAANRRLRVGYLSSFLRDHPIGHVTAALFAAHDRARFEVHVFYLPDSKPSAFTQTISEGAEHFITLPDTAAAMTEAVAACDLDILIYLDGYMSLALLPVVAARPAPVQIFWLGHAGNCEISGIDYVIGDDTVIPPEDEALYSAKVVRLPGTYHCASPHPIAPASSRAAAGLPAEGFVFCAFNNPEKIDRTVFDVWMRILGRVDGSVLWLSRTLSAAVVDNLRAAATAQGIDGARLIFAPRLPDKAGHLARHRLCGLFLDTLTLNASTTALDALWSGLPVLTVPGARFGSRIAASFLRAVGLDDMIVPTLEAYEARAVHLATQPEALRIIHTRLADNRATHPLFQIEAFCRKLETCLDRIDRNHAPGVGPATGR